jgi:LmbE family N-acetylglucosaminyl deacetylase
MKRILIVAAHPDDEILGCGGTIIRRINEGDEVYSLVLGEGITSRYQKRILGEEVKLKELHDSYNKVCKFMGFKNWWLYKFPDNRFDSVDLLDIVKVVESIKEELQPEIVYTHFENDLNIDHRLTFQAVLTACRPLNTESVKEILSFEIPSSTEWVSSSNAVNNFNPNIFVNIEDTIDKKIEAIKIYKSELREYPHPRSLDALRIISQRWGIVSGLNFAEAFITIRKVIR